MKDVMDIERWEGKGKYVLLGDLDNWWIGMRREVEWREGYGEGKGEGGWLFLY